MSRENGDQRFGVAAVFRDGGGGGVVTARGVRGLAVLALIAATRGTARAQEERGPDTVVVRSGALTLRALVWRPPGRGPFPAVLFNHGSGHGVLAPSGDHYEHTTEWQIEQLAPVFVRHGYLF